MNKHEIKAYEQAIAKYNPFHGVNFPITSVQLCKIINGLREKYNEKVIELRHRDLMAKIDSFSGRNFSLAESEYLDDQKIAEFSGLNFQVAETGGDLTRGHPQ